MPSLVAAALALLALAAPAGSSATTLVASSATTLVASSATSLAASPATSVAREATGDGTRLSFSFDDVVASSHGAAVPGLPRRSSGTVLTDGAAQLKGARGATGRAARFPCLSCGRAIIEVPDRSALDPGTDTFAFGASVRVTPRQGAGSMNVVQKGWYDEPGGQYKLQVDAGRPSCVVTGSAGRVTAAAPDVDVADGAWHQLTCTRSGDVVELAVDGAVRASVTAATGALANAAPVWVGGKALTSTDPDQFRGRMDDVFVRIQR